MRGGTTKQPRENTNNKPRKSYINHRNLDAHYLTHKLKGNYSDCLECHIKPNWIGCLAEKMISGDETRSQIMQHETDHDIFAIFECLVLPVS